MKSTLACILQVTVQPFQKEQQNVHHTRDFKWWDEDVCAPCPGRVPVWWLTTWLDSRAVSPKVNVCFWKMSCGDNSNSMTYHSSWHTPFLSSGGEKPTSFSFSSIILSESCQKPAVLLTCAYPIQSLLLFLSLLEDQAGPIKYLSCERPFIATTACSAVLHNNGFRKCGYLVVWASLIIKPIGSRWANPTFQFKNCEDQLEKDCLKMFHYCFF